MFKAASYVGSKLCQPGDIVIVRTRAGVDLDDEPGEGSDEGAAADGEDAGEGPAGDGDDDFGGAADAAAGAWGRC